MSKREDETYGGYIARIEAEIAALKTEQRKYWDAESAAMNITEEMGDAPRGFLAGLEMGITTLKDMRNHLDQRGDDYSCWPKWAKNQDGHLTKMAKAILIYTMMRAVALKADRFQGNDDN